MSIAVVATAIAKPDRSEEFGMALRALVEPSRADDGCEMYVVHRSLDEPNTWLVYEQWASKEHLDRHLATPHLVGFLEQAPELLTADLDLKVLSIG